MNEYLTIDFDLACDISSQGRYDYVIVGSGLGGGVLARKLIEKGKRILLIEKGGLSFSTHCLNTSRPHWQVGSLQGPSQDNDIVFEAVKQKVQTAAGSDPYVGGPVYCLGGRSNVWGLYSPMIDETTLKDYFPERIWKYLLKPGEGYENAFNLLTNWSQTGGVYPTDQATIAEFEDTQKRLTKAIEEFYRDKSKPWCLPSQAPPSHTPAPEPTCLPGIKVTRAPIASQFNSPAPYYFPQGAYSTVDALLDQVYARNPNLTILTNTEVLLCQYATTGKNKYKASYLTVRTMPSQRIGQIYAKEAIILCAGTIGTATIALNSGLSSIRPYIGKGLTDHQIWGVRFAKKINEKAKDPMKFQCEMKILGERTLLNVAVNANTFFGRGSAIFSNVQYWSNKGELLDIPQGKGEEGYDTVNVTLEYKADLQDDNRVLDIPTPGPVIYVKNSELCHDKARQKRMRDLATKIRDNLLLQHLGSKHDRKRAPRLSVAGFGVVAHEVGTMRLKQPYCGCGCCDCDCDSKFVVNEKYQVEGFSNLYVCDLSIFPVSPPANPSLTLAALAIQLAEDLCPGTN